jgi:hypothetical protein
MSYRFDPAGPGGGQIQRIEDDQGSRVRLQLGLDGCQLGAGAGSSQPGHSEAEPEPVGQLVGIDALGRGDGLDPPYSGPLPTFAEEDQHGAGGGAGEVVQPRPPAGDRDSQVESGPGLAGLLLSGQDRVGVGRPQPWMSQRGSPAAATLAATSP